MPRHRKASSVRGKRETSKLFSDAFEGTKKALASINKALDEEKMLTDEQYRFLKKCPSLIEMYTTLEEGKETEDVLPEGELKQWVDNHIRLQNKIIKATGEKRFKLTAEKMKGIAYKMGYYLCDLCGHYHVVGRDCFIDEYVKLIQESNSKTE